MGAEAGRFSKPRLDCWPRSLNEFRFPWILVFGERWIVDDGILIDGTIRLLDEASVGGWIGDWFRRFLRRGDDAFLLIRSWNLGRGFGEVLASRGWFICGVAAVNWQLGVTIIERMTLARQTVPQNWQGQWNGQYGQPTVVPPHHLPTLPSMSWSLERKRKWARFENDCLCVCSFELSRDIRNDCSSVDLINIGTK